jgi:hypothetical protein
MAGSDRRQLPDKIMTHIVSTFDRTNACRALRGLGQGKAVIEWQSEWSLQYCWGAPVCWKQDQVPAFVMAVMNPVLVVACFLDGGRHLTKLTCNDFNEQLFRAAVRLGTS